MVKRKENLILNQEIKQHVKRERETCSLHQDLRIWRTGELRNMSNQGSKTADGSENGVVRQNFISHMFNQTLSIFKDLRRNHQHLNKTKLLCYRLGVVYSI